MKAIILLFDGKYAVNGEEEIAKIAAASIYENTDIDDISKISAITLNDAEMAKALVSSITKPVAVKEEVKTDVDFEIFCRNVITHCGRPEDATFKKNLAEFMLKSQSHQPTYAFLKLLISESKLTRMRQDLLKEYRIEKIRTILREVNKVLLLF